MQRIPLFPILCLLVLTASAYADPALVKKVEPSVVLIKTDKGLGSGFIVSEDKVVTNYHVIRGASKVDITFSGEDSPTFTSKGYHLIDEKRDIAVLSLKLTPGATADYMKPVKLAAKHPDKGEDVLAIGNPIGLDFSVSEGIVSAVRKAGAPDDMYLKNHEGEWIQHTAAISEGNSGGPLFNMDGEVVGMNTLSIASEKVQSLNFAVCTTDIKSALNIADKSTLRKYKVGEGVDGLFGDFDFTPRHLELIQKELETRIGYLKTIGAVKRLKNGTVYLRPSSNKKNTQFLYYPYGYPSVNVPVLWRICSPWGKGRAGDNFAFSYIHMFQSGKVYAIKARKIDMLDSGVLMKANNTTFFFPFNQRDLGAFVNRFSPDGHGEFIGLIDKPVLIKTEKGPILAIVVFDIDGVIDRQWLINRLTAERTK